MVLCRNSTTASGHNNNWRCHATLSQQRQIFFWRKIRKHYSTHTDIYASPSIIIRGSMSTRNCNIFPESFRLWPAGSEVKWAWQIGHCRLECTGRGVTLLFEKYLYINIVGGIFYCVQAKSRTGDVSHYSALWNCHGSGGKFIVRKSNRLIRLLQFVTVVDNSK